MDGGAAASVGSSSASWVTQMVEVVRAEISMDAVAGIPDIATIEAFQSSRGRAFEPCSLLGRLGGLLDGTGRGGIAMTPSGLLHWP